MDDHTPTFETRPEQRYVGKRAVLPMSKFPEAISAMTEELSAWLHARSTAPSGPSFLRYQVIDMPNRMDVEVAFPVEHAPEPERSVSSGALPAGRYGTLTFTGLENGAAANRRLIEWIVRCGEEPDCSGTPEGDACAGCIETLLTDPQAEPDQTKWKTQVSIKVRDA